MNLNFNVPLPMPKFENVTAKKLRKQLAEIRGEKRESSNFSSEENDQKNEEQKNTSYYEDGQKKEQKRKGPTPRWLKLLLAALVVAVALPTIIWLLGRIAALIRAAKGVQDACLA